MFVDFNKLGVDYLLVNSTNEFLAEYSSLKENARYLLTGFSGSTGDALWSRTGEIYLFVDGRVSKLMILNIVAFLVFKYWF